MSLASKNWVDKRIDESRRPAHPPRLSAPGGGGDMDWSQVAFGYSLSGNKVTVTTGAIRHGTRAAITIAETEITISADNTWIYVEYTIGTSASLVSETDTPANTESVLAVPLHLWRLTSGIASIGRICHIGDIIIPGIFA